MRHIDLLPVFPRKSWVVLAAGTALSMSPAMIHADDHQVFRRIASFPAFANYDIDTESVAEIVAASGDGMTLMYTDGENGSLGFVDITDPANPAALGAVPLGGQPTSVAAAGGYALVAVNTSPDFVDPSGHLAVVEIATRAIVAIHDLGGQPDSVAVSTDGRYAAIAIENEDTVYTVQDSFYEESRILVMDVEDAPAKVKGEIVLRDMHGKIPAMPRAVVNDDLTVNLDPEGIATRAAGGFWIVSEGAGTAGDLGRPSETLNLLLKVGDSGGVQDVVTLPDAVNDRQVRFGYEGVAAVGRGDGEVVYVAFQREWLGDPDDRVRIGRYDTHSGEWTFFYYPIEAPLSANGGWVGLSDLAYLGGDRFAVVERDNQGGPDAVIKRLYAFSVAGLTPLPDDGSNPPAFPLVAKTLVRDLVPDLQATGGLVPEKIEGLAVNDDGDALVVNDNDGVDDSNGETQLLRLEGLFDGD